MSNNKLAILSLILANIIWGASFPIYKWTLESIPIFTFAFFRFFLGALVLFPFAIKNLHIVKKDYLLLFLASIIPISIQIPLLLFGLTLAPSVNAPIIISSGPIFLIIASALFLKDKVRVSVLAGTFISLFGILVIILQPFLDIGLSKGILGNLVIFIATLCGVFQAIVLKKLTKRNNPLAITFWTFLIGSLFLFIPAYFFENNLINISYFTNTHSLIGILYGAILASALAHFLLTYGIRFIKTSEIGVFSYIDPIATVIVAVPLLNERITTFYVLGALLVFLGIFIAEERINYHPLGKLFK